MGGSVPLKAAQGLATSESGLFLLLFKVRLYSLELVSVCDFGICDTDPALVDSKIDFDVKHAACRRTNVMVLRKTAGMFKVDPSKLP